MFCVLRAIGSPDLGALIMVPTDFLIKIGMYKDFSNVWHAIGWDNSVPVEEYGSRLLTIQFVCTLREVENGVYFRLFGKEYLLSWKTLAGHLDFNKCWPISLEQACHGFNRHEFWGQISGQVIHGKFAPRCNDIHNPTLSVFTAEPAQGYP